MPMRRENVAAALKYLQDKANLRQRFERATSLDPQEQDLADIAVETAAGFIPGVGQALAARDVERARRANDPAGMAMASMGAIPGGRLAGLLKRYDPVMQQLDVYQGSPHRYAPTENNPLGELDSSKIGTGEGAQAYGYGHYLAENPEVAEGYRVGTTFAQKPSRDIAEMLYSQKSGDADAAIVNLKSEIKQLEKQGMPVGYREQYDSALRKLEEFKVNPPKVGHLYKADLPDEMIDRMLDWDKPLSEQRELATPILKELGYLRPNDNGPRQFAEAVKALSLEHGGFGESGATGMGLFNAIYKGLQQGKPKAIDLAKRMNLTEQEMFMEASPLASEVMKRMGIPGIKYLDAGSRGQGGSGTRNFVVFPGEEKKVRILERDGQKAPPQKIAQALEATAQKTTAVEVPDVLHGSPMRGLTNLSPSKSMEVRGATWFSDNPDVADQYTFPREYGEILDDAEPGEIYKARLSFKNPMTVDMEGKVGDAMELSKLVKKAKEEGYDGLILRNVDDSVDSSKLLGTSYAVFDPSQIKLKKK